MAKVGASSGGKARAAALTPERRSEIARMGVLAKAAKRKGIYIADSSSPKALGESC